MALVHWEEKLDAAARAFAAHEDEGTRMQLRTAAYGLWHWHSEVTKAKKREGIA
jgi:hypothetical protein